MAQYIKAKKIEWGNITFDSQFEFNIFQLLKSHFKLTQIEVHKPLTIRPESVYFPAQKWKIDFVVTSHLFGQDFDSLYIEVKGLVQLCDKERFRNIAYFLPEVYRNLVVISPVTQTVVRGLISYGANDFAEMLAKGKYVEMVTNNKRARL